METNADNLTLLEERVKENEFYRCVPFQYKTVELQDPATNRIAQWLDRTSVSGILDLSQPLSSEAPQGTYTLHAETDSGNHIRQFFKIKEYVLPKYEVKVHLPKSITILDTEVTVKICAKYTYGKPVLGKVTGKFCRPKWNMYWYRRPDNVENNDICHLFNTGECCIDELNCISTHSLTNPDMHHCTRVLLMYVNNWSVAASNQVQEKHSLNIIKGVQLSGSSSSKFTSKVNEVSFEGAQNSFKKGIPFKAKARYSLLDNVFDYQLVRPTYGIADLWLNPFYSKSKSFLKIQENEGKLQCGEEAPISIVYIIQGEELAKGAGFMDFYYLVLAKGSIARNGRVGVPMKAGQVSEGEFSFKLPVSSHLAPYAQVLVYAVFPNGEIVADSFDFQVDTCFKNKARYSLLDNVFDYQLVRPTYGIADLWLNPFYSKSKSFLKIQENEGKLQCGEEAPISIVYIIQGEELAKGAGFMDFYYLVLAKGSIARNGRVGVPMKAGQVSEGEFSFKLPVSSHLAPYAQVLVYAVFLNGEIVADSFDFQVDTCFKNKVDLKFSAPQELPGEDTTVHLRADPGSLCALRAVDQSVILMEPDKELTVDTVYKLLPTQKRDGYSYRVEDYEPYPCLPSPFHRLDKRSIMPYYHSRSHNDVYGIFKVGIIYPLVELPPSSCSIDRIKESGSVEITRTVPDTITEWKAGAFCTSPLGFGMAPPTGLTAFQPFFVELTLPYSVIRGEQFELKATVFNYLSQCIMVKVSHAESSQFQMTPCEGCEYTTCLCADEARTFRWAFIPSALGEVNVTVSAQALQTDTLCGNEVVAVPERGRIDTVIRKLLVEAEGIEQTVTQNALMCPGGSAVKEEISLKLPEVTVNGSAKASLSVLGDLLGRAMQNLDRLLAMPFGCGEQNMVLFAPNIYILKYLQGTGQLTEEIKAKATRFLESGYQRELNYKHEDGSYSAFGKSDDSGNTW
ncbi:UNVERIFIED_CONTAM: hypothetical protein FKN15_012917 [Acipenser sinensis]